MWVAMLPIAALDVEAGAEARLKLRKRIERGERGMTVLATYIQG